MYCEASVWSLCECLGRPAIFSSEIAKKYFLKTDIYMLQGVMLTHSNLLYQLNNLKHFLQPSPRESSLSLLPPWHIYERSCGYFIYSCGMKQVYTNIRRFREDLTRFPPQFFVCVPLVIDTLQTKVTLPGRLSADISGLL